MILIFLLVGLPRRTFVLFVVFETVIPTDSHRTWGSHFRNSCVWDCPSDFAFSVLFSFFCFSKLWFPPSAGITFPTFMQFWLPERVCVFSPVFQNCVSHPAQVSNFRSSCTLDCPIVCVCVRSALYSKSWFPLNAGITFPLPRFRDHIFDDLFDFDFFRWYVAMQKRKWVTCKDVFPSSLAHKFAPPVRT